MLNGTSRWRRTRALTLTLPLCACVILLALAGCRGDDDAAQGEVVRRDLTLLAAGSAAADSQRMQAALDAYAAKAPQHALHLTTVARSDELEKRLAGDGAPDVFTVDAFTFPGLAKRGLLAAWPAGSQFAAELPNPLREAFAPGGSLLCAPRDVSPLVLVYSRQLFADASVAEPNANWTWDDFRTAADTLTNLEQGEHGLVAPLDLTRWLPYLWQSGIELSDAGATRMTVASPAAEGALAYIADLYAQLIAVTPADVGASWSGEALGRGRAAMVIEGPWIVDYLEESFPDLDFGAAPLPFGGASLPAVDASARTLAFASCYAMRTGADAVVAEFAQSLVDDEALRTWNTGRSLPPQRALLDRLAAEQATLLPWIESVDQARVPRFPGDFEALTAAFRSAAQAVIDENLTAAEALAEFAAVGDDLIANQ